MQPIIRIMMMVLADKKKRETLLTAIIAIIIAIVMAVTVLFNFFIAAVLMNNLYYFPMPDFTYINSPYDLERVHPIYKTPRPHLGADMPAPEGTEILCPKDGIVTGVVLDPLSLTSGGSTITLLHSNGQETKYRHCSEIKKNIGDIVKIGDVIALCGNTGYSSTGPHLHFEILVLGVPIDPEPFLVPWP